MKKRERREMHSTPEFKTNVPAVQVQSPTVERSEPMISVAKPDFRYWPEGAQMPEAYIKRLIPCEACRRVRMDDGGQAVAVERSGDQIVYLRCKACGHRFRLPVETK